MSAADSASKREAIRKAGAVAFLVLAVYCAVVGSSYYNMPPVLMAKAHLLGTTKHSGVVVPIPAFVDDLHWDLRGREKVIAAADLEEYGQPAYLRNFVHGLIEGSVRRCGAIHLEEARVQEIMADLHMDDPRPAAGPPCP
jgi:hypothetical protein